MKHVKYSMFGLIAAAASFSMSAHAQLVPVGNPAYGWYDTFNTPGTSIPGALTGEATCLASPIPTWEGVSGVTCTTAYPGNFINFIYGMTDLDAWWIPNGEGNNPNTGNEWGIGNFYSGVGAYCSNNKEYFGDWCSNVAGQGPGCAYSSTYVDGPAEQCPFGTSIEWGYFEVWATNTKKPPYPFTATQE
jgi:hypothetical protein